MAARSEICLFELDEGACAELEETFSGTPLARPAEQIRRHVLDAAAGAREAIGARCSGAAAGYGTLCWSPTYAPFRGARVPEIQDLNVAPAFRRRGVASAILDELEARARHRSATVGIGFGLYRDYGAAQRLYVRRGYVPDGRGLHYAARALEPGDTTRVDDDLVLYLIRDLR